MRLQFSRPMKSRTNNRYFVLTFPSGLPTIPAFCEVNVTHCPYGQKPQPLTHETNRTHATPPSNRLESHFRPDPGPFHRRFLQRLHHTALSRVHGQTEPDFGPGGADCRRQPVSRLHRSAGGRLPGRPLPGPHHHSRRSAHDRDLHSPFRHCQQLWDADAFHRPGVGGVLDVSPIRGRHDSPLFRQGAKAFACPCSTPAAPWPLAPVLFSSPLSWPPGALVPCRTMAIGLAAMVYLWVAVPSPKSEGMASLGLIGTLKRQFGSRMEIDLSDLAGDGAAGGGRSVVHDLHARPAGKSGVLPGFRRADDHPVHPGRHRQRPGGRLSGRPGRGQAGLPGFPPADDARPCW
jgi:hypothetical protein